MAYNQQITDGESGAGGVTKINDYWQRVRYPEDYGAVADGVADDDTPLSEYFTQLSLGINKSIGASVKTIYLTSGKYTIEGTPTIKFPGVVKRTASSAQTPLFTLDLGTANFTEIDLNADGNSSNTNPGIGFYLNGGNANVKARHTLAATHFDTGIFITNIIEKTHIDAFPNICGVGVEVNNDGSAATPDEISLRIFAGGCDQVFKATGTEKISGNLYLNSEGGEDATKYNVDIQNGVWSAIGEVRGCEGGGLSVTTTAAQSVIAKGLTLFGAGSGAALPAVMSDSATCVLDLSLALHNWTDGLWIKRCAGGSFAHITKRDSGSTGTGLRIGDFANSKQAAFNFKGVLFGQTYALHLDYATNSSVDIDLIIDGGGILISANSSGNRININKASSGTVITNNRTQNDNTIIYKGNYSNAELELINGGTFFKGMIVEASSDTTVYGRLFWNGSNWKSENGLTYNTGTNTWS